MISYIIQPRRSFDFHWKGTAWSEVIKKDILVFFYDFIFSESRVNVNSSTEQSLMERIIFFFIVKLLNGRFWSESIPFCLTVMVAMNKIILQLFDVLDMGYARVVLRQEDPSDLHVVLLSGWMSSWCWISMIRHGKFVFMAVIQDKMIKLTMPYIVISGF